MAMYIKGTYRRNNEGDYHCTEAQVKAMIRDSNADGNDSILIEYYGIDDIDPDSLRQYRTEFRQENSTHVWNRVDDKTFLRNLGGYTEDRQTGREGLTLAGLMMFGKGLAIRECNRRDRCLIYFQQIITKGTTTETL